MGQQDIRSVRPVRSRKIPVLLNGTQALVRLMLMQKARDGRPG
jgi:indolepyruvate ferredoxin oxidoreductase